MKLVGKGPKESKDFRPARRTPNSFWVTRARSISMWDISDQGEITSRPYQKVAPHSLEAPVHISEDRVIVLCRGAKTLYSFLYDGDIFILDWKVTAPRGVTFNGATLSNDLLYVEVASKNEQWLELYDPITGIQRHRISIPPGTYHYIKIYFSDLRMYLSTRLDFNGEDTVYVFRPETSDFQHITTTPTVDGWLLWFYGVTPDDKYFCFGGERATYLFEIETKTIVLKSPIHHGILHAPDPKKHRWVSASWDGLHLLTPTSYDVVSTKGKGWVSYYGGEIVGKFFLTYSAHEESEVWDCTST